MSMDLTTRQTFWNMTMGTFLIWSCHLTFSQSCVQRIVALPTLGDSRRALVLFCFGVVSIMFINCFTGIIMFAYYYDCDPLQANVSACRDTRSLRSKINDMLILSDGQQSEQNDSAFRSRRGRTHSWNARCVHFMRFQCVAEHCVGQCEFTGRSHLLRFHQAAEILSSHRTKGTSHHENDHRFARHRMCGGSTHRREIQLNISVDEHYCRNDDWACFWCVHDRYAVSIRKQTCKCPCHDKNATNPLTQ